MTKPKSIASAFAPGVLIGLRRRGRPLAALAIVNLLLPLLSPAAALAQSDAGGSAPPSDDGAAAERTRASSAISLKAAPSKAAVDAVAADEVTGNTGARTGTLASGADELKEKASTDLADGAKQDTGQLPGSEPVETKGVVTPGSSADKTGASSQAISVPKGAGTIQGMGESFSAQLSTGVATFSVPFSLPAARGGAQPSLGLSYSSSSGWGIAGMGWDVGVPFISRQADRGLPGYDDRSDYWSGQDRFVFNGGQELVPICTVGGSSSAPTCEGALPGEEMPGWSVGSQYFRPRVEGSFLRFFWSVDHLTWRVQDKTGVTMELGVPLDGSGYRGGVLVNSEKPEAVARWSLVRQYDTQGIANPTSSTALVTPNNVVVYRYHSSEPALTLTDIYDTSPAAAPTSSDLSKFAHHAHLEYESRPDPTVSYHLGFKLERRLRLARVDVTSSTFNYGTDRLRQQLRRYYITYESGLNSSLLSSVQMEGRCGGSDLTESSAPSENPDGTLRPSNCPRLPAMTFDYTHVLPYSTSGTSIYSSLPGFEGFDERVRQIASSPNHSVDEAEADFFDLNGDALPDFLVTGPAGFNGGFGQFWNAPGGAVDTFSAPSSLPMLGGANAGTLRLNNPNVAILDLDGDAQVDLLHTPVGKTYWVYPLRGTGLLGRQVTTDDIKVDFGRDATATRVMDVNGDGLVDVVVTAGREMQTYFALGRKRGGADRFGRAVRTCLPWSNKPLSFGDPEIQLGDMNGDGLTDIVNLQYGKLHYWPGRGNGVWGTGLLSDCPANQFASGTEVLMDKTPAIVDAGSLRIDDINGDGLDDLVKITGSAITVWLNVNGVSWTGPKTIDGAPASPDFVNRVRVLDVNGSGTRDLVWGDAGHFQYIDLLGGQRPWLLRRVSNGLGKTTDIEYSTSTAEMLEAERQGRGCSSTDWTRPWCHKMPIVTQVVKRVTESDNLTFAHFTPTVVVSEYEYRDPYYDGRQREFRGFRRARSRSLGDASSPTSYSESQFLLGECVESPSSTTSCDDLSGDNPREALKGLPVVTEQYDESGRYLATDATGYRLRLLYQGRDGRDVRHAFAATTRKTLYDVAAGVFSAGPSVAFNAIEVEEGADPNFDPLTTPKGLPAGLTFETVQVPVRSSTGVATIESRSQVDYFGNQQVAVALGCTSGAACPDTTATPGLDPNQSIYSVTVPGRPTGDVTRWLWRTIRTYVSGDYRSSVLQDTTNSYDTRGNLLTVEKQLAGTLDLLRKHRTLTGAGATAPAPTDASTNGLKTLVTNTYDPVFGNLTQTQGTNGRCRKLSYDAAAKGYQQLVVVEQTFTSPGCTGSSLSTGAAYDRGYSQVTTVTDPTGQPTYAAYDSFGRPTSVKRALPGGAIAAEGSVLPSVSVSYSLATPTRPYSYIETSTQDAGDVATSHYRWQVAIVDGAGRTRLARSQADTTSLDVEDAIEDGIVQLNAKGAVVRQYLAQFSNAPKDGPLPSAVTAPFRRVEYDAFGRALRNFDLSTSGSGVQTVRIDYHALSEDTWDAADLGLEPGGAHQDTFATTRRDGHGRTIVTTERVKVGNSVDPREVRWIYQTSGEPISITRFHTGDLAVSRWMRYDTFGRPVMNVEPHTTVNFNEALGTNPSLTGMRPWLYAYNDAGDLVGTSDARGCGTNYTYDAAGRLTSEDYSPCEPEHAPYSAPNFTDHTGIEVYYQYDSVPTSFSDVVGVPAGSGLNALPSSYVADASSLNGRLAAVYDRSGLLLTTYDARGRVLRTDRRLAAADAAVTDPRLRYRGRWYSSSTTYDAEDRVITRSTGAESAELLENSKSELTVEYSNRGTIKKITGSYGELVSSVKRSADGLVEEVVYGDVAGTKATQTYNDRRWLATSKVTRTAPTLWMSPPADYLPAPAPNASPSTSFQTKLRDESFGYDVVGNPTAITDLRLDSAWPAGAKPVSRTVTYDDLYRVTGVSYAYSTGSMSVVDDTAVSPLAAELAGTTNPRQSRNVPTQLLFAQRIRAQTLEYDWLGNLTNADDNTHTTWERGVGPVSSNATTSASTNKPYQWKATGKVANPGWVGTGSAVASAYDEAGNLLGVQISKVGTCSNGASTCAVNFSYKWDEVGRLNRAYRSEGGVTVADLSYRYDANDNRILKSEGTGPTPLHTVYLFDTLELRRATYNTSTGDYLRDATTETVFLNAGGEGIGRLTYESAANGEPRIAGNRRHVYLNIGDHLGSSSVVIDKATSELVERRTYLAYGATESDYRPARWKGFREDYGFTGKEEDVEVGLQYFGKRFLSPYLGRWASADPLAVHAPGKADLNLYAYVSGMVLKSVDPLGLDPPRDQGAGGAPSSGAKETSGENGGSRGAGSAVANGESVPAQPKSPCDMHSCVLRADVEPAFSMVEDSKERAEEQKVEEARGKMSVTVNGATPDLVGGNLMRSAGFRHQWVVFNDGTAAGMGNDKGVPGEGGQTSPDLPGAPTQIVDHKGRVPEVTKRVDWVDVDTLKQWMSPGRKTGPWIPLVNDCNVTVNKAVDASTPQDRFGPEGTILKNVVMYPDGSFHSPSTSPPWVGASRASDEQVGGD
jgi:RHS repeat-associated protein